MEKKKIAGILVGICVISFVAYGLFHKPTKHISTDMNQAAEEHVTNEDAASVEENEETTEKQERITNTQGEKKKALNVSIQKNESFTKNADLYSNLPSSSLPLSAISEIANLPENIKQSIDRAAENSNRVYMIQNQRDKVFMVIDNPANIRHSIEFIEINPKTGIQTDTTLGYNDKIHDSDNDIWNYDTVKRPVRHTKYDSEGDVEFIETWNYNETDPVKYEMKDKDGKVISIRKETIDNGTDLRSEHVLYDKEGNTKMSVSVTYEGMDLKRFSYYNADKPQESATISGEYTDGLKTKETVYTPDLKVKNVYTSKYTDGTREDVTVYDSNNQEIKKFVSEE